MGKSRKLFETDGIRGKANRYPITCDIATSVGRSAASYFLREKGKQHRIIIGKDTRLSGYMLEFALSAGICSAGCNALLVGTLPTPGIAFLTRDMRADAGVVISASHNPFEDNGVKFFNRQGIKLADDVESTIEQIMASEEALEDLPIMVGRAKRIEDAVGRYIVFLKRCFPLDRTLEGITIALDTANGAAYKVAPTVFAELGAKVHHIGKEPNGTNINQDCGALHPEKVGALVRETGADLGIALDGDADRLILCDETGKKIDGDYIMAAMAKKMIADGTLRHNTLVATVMSNMGLEIAVNEAGGKMLRTVVGDRYVAEQMRQGGYNLGGEQSGHLIFGDHHTTGDGILSALMVLSELISVNKPLSEFAQTAMKRLPQVLINVPVREKPPLATLEKVTRAIKDVEKELAGKGRSLIRFSGTEMKARVMVEGENQQVIERQAQKIADALHEVIGVA
jgi:phosphoglucosamine mutase